MSQFILKGEALVQKIKQKTGLSDYKKELRDEIQSFYDNFIIPYQTDQNSNTQIGQQNYESIMKQLYQEYIQILKYTQMTFNDNEIQQMRYFVLDKIVEDSKKPVQPINTELIDSLNNIIQDDNNKNSFLGIKALFQIIKCQSDKLNQGLNQRHEVSPLMFFSMGNLDLIYCIINQFMNQKMLNFQNLKNLFQQQKDKQQYSNYLKDQTIQKQINLQQQNEMPLIENKYDLRIYEEMTATVTVTMIFLGGAQKIDSIQKQGDILQKIKQIIETSKNYLKAGVNAIFNTNFEFTQSEFNRKFHEDLGNVHRKMILYIQEVYTIIQQQIDQNANSSIYISDLLRVTSSYVSKFPDEYIDIKIQLYKIYQKVLFAQQNFNDNDLNKYALNYNEVFMMDRLVSNYSKIEILTLYLKIIQIIFTIEPNQQNQNGQLIRIHQTSKISQLNDQKVQEMVKMVIEILISTIYDNSINLDIQMRIVDILYSLINKYITQDNEYFKRQINHDQLINKIKYLEEILKFISSKYKDLNFVLISIQNFLKKQFIKSQQQSKQPIAQHNQQVHLPVQTPHSNIQNITQPVQQQRLQQPPNQPQGVTQQIQIRPAQPRVMPNGPLNTQAVLQKKNMQQQQNTSVEDELSLQKKYIEWIQKKKNQVSISTFPKMQRVKKDDSSELEKIQQEILENEDYYTFQVENLTKLNAREDIQGEFEGEFLQFHGIEIKRENLQYYFAQLTYFIRAFIHFQYKIQQILYSKNTEYKKQFQPNELSNAFKQYNLNQTQLNILRKIFKNGIELLTNYHQMYHVEAKFIEQSVVKSFIKIFAVIEHECHFKDIIEPNFKLILKLLIKTYQDNDKSQCQCSRQILETAFQESSNTQPSNPPNYFPTASFFNHILLKNFFLLIEQSNETLDPFNEFYGLYKNKFFETIQHLMKSVFTGIIVQYDNDQYKQIIKKSILFLFKKIHTSPYPLEYLKLLKWFAYELSEQIMKNSNKESQIKPEINSICKSSDKMIEDKQVDYLNQETTSLEKQLSENKELTEDKKAQIKERLKQLKDECRNFEGINILDNITQLLELNSSKFQAQIVKISLCLPNLYSQNLDLQRKKQAAKILLICTTINERNFATQALNQLDNMISKLSREELEVTLEDIKEELIDRLFQIASENRPIDFTLKNEELEKLVKQSRQNQQPNINQRLTDNSKIAFRLLSKLQFLTKQHKIHTFIFENESAPEVQEKIYLEFDILQNNTNEKPKKSIFKLDIKQSVEHAICLFNRIINNFSNQPMKSNVIDVSFALIKFCVVKYFCRCDNLDIKWLYENENGARLQEQHAQKSQQGQQQQGKQIEEVIQEEFEVKKKILREFNFEQHQQEEAEQCLDSKFDCLFGTSSSPSQNSSNLLIMKLLKVLMDLTSIDQKIERDQGLLLKIRKESERILTIISKVISQNIIDLTLFQLGQNQITNQFYFKNMFANMNSPQHVFIATIVKSLKNSNFMERRNNLKTQTCSEKQFLWNELLIKNIYKNLQTDGTKHIIQQAQQQHPNSTQMVLEPSPKMANYESEQAKQVVDLMIGELENFVINMLTKEIGNSNDSFSQTSNSRQLFFPSCDTSQQLSTNQVMGSSIISSHNFESPSDSRMFDNNNNSLNKRYCLVECLNEVMNIFKPKIIGKHIQNILDCAYIISNNLPEVVNLQSMQDFCQLLIKKILQYIKKQKEQYNLNSPQLRKVLQTFVNNLTTCKPISHLYSRNALNSIAKIHNTNVISILYLSQNGNTNEDVKFCDTFDQLIAQAKKDDDLADNLASIQQLEQMPSKYDYATLVKNHRNLYITDLLIQIYTAISMFQQEYGTSGNLYYTQNSQINRKLLCIFNCYKSLEYLLACENCLPFKLISIQRIQETPQDLNQSNQQPKLLFTFKFDDSFLKMIFTSQKILEKNNKEMKTSRIILSNTQEGTPQNMMPPHVNVGQNLPPQGINQPQNLLQQPMPVPPNNQPAQSLQDLNQPMNKVIPGRGSVGENMFPGGPNTPNPRNQNGLMMQPHPNPLPNHPPNMNPNNQNGRLINQYPNNPQALTQPNQPYPANAPPARPNNQYQANPNMPPPNPNNPNYPPPVPGYQYNMNNQPNRPMPPNINMNNMQRPINPPPASGQAPAQTKNQNSFINQCQLFYEDELGLNIEDLNFNIKNWAKLLSSIILILKQINLSIPTKYFNSLIDKEEKKIIEQTNPNYVRIPAELRAKTFEKIEEINYQNLNKLYEMMPRIEKTIHSTVQESIIEINKKNGNNNKVALEEEKLKVILRPLLVCLQSPFHRFTPQFLLIFKKLLKMLINCFNGRLIVLLLQKLDDIIKDTSNIQNEQSFSNYKIKNVSGVLTMFQHLKNPFYQQKGSREAVSSKEQIKQIINSTIEIQKNYSTRYGWHYVEQKTLIPISKLLNVQTEFVTEILMKDKKMVQNSQQQNDPLNSLTDQALEFIYKVIKMDKSFELRESLTREYQDQDFLIRFWDPQRNLQLQLKIIYLLAKKSSRVFKQQKIDGIKFLIEENKKSPNTNLMNYKNYMLFMKLFILYFQRKRDTNIFNCITSIYNERYPCPHFIKRFFEEQVPGLLTLEQKKRLLLSTLTNMYSNMDVPQIRVMLKLIIKPIVKSLTKEQIIQMNIQPLNQQGRPGQLMIHFFFDAQKKFEERFKKFQSDVQNIPHLQQQIQSIQQQQQQGFQQMLNKLQYEIRKITRNNDRFSKELLQLELSRIAFLFGKELNQEILKRFQNNIFTVIQQNLEQTENPLIKQLYYQLQIKIIRMQNQQGDLQYKKQLLSNIFKAYNFSAQEANKNITLQQMVVNNVNYFIKNISNTKQIRQENQKQLQQQPLPQLQSAAATQNQQQQLVMQFKIDQQGQQGNQANQMQNNQAIPPLNINHQSYQELKANYEIVREFLDMDKDKIIFNAIIQQNEFFYDIREIIAGDIFKEIKEQYLIYKEKAKNEREKIKKFQQTLDDENGSIMNLWDQQNDQKNYERSIYLLNLINTYVCWKFREIKEGSKNKENPNAQRTEIDKIQERKFSKRSIHLLVHFIFDSIEERLESYQVLLKKCLILWNNSKIDYKMIKYKYIFNMLKMDNEFILNMQKNTYTKNHVTKYCYFVLNILNICLECSSYTETNYNDQIKQFLKILNWSTTYVLNKQKSRNKNPSISAPANTNPQQNPQQSANNNIPNNQISLTPQGSNQNQNSITLDGAGQGQKNMMQKNMMFNNQIKKQEKAIIKERKECYSLMNSSELEPYMVIMVANILYQLLSVYEEDPHDKQIKESKANLINQIKINIENHHFQIDGQEMQSQEIQPPMSVELIVKLIIYQANLNIDDLYVIRLNQILMILENQNKKHKTKENDKIQYDKLFYENFFCQKYANYIPHNSCFYFETSKLSAQNLLSKFYEEKIEIEQQQQGIDDFLQQEVTQQLQNRKNRYIQLLKREAGFETMQWEIDQHLKYSMSLKDHQEFFEFPFIRQFNSNLSHFQKYSQAQNLLGLMYISLCLLPATKEKNQDSLLQNVKRILKVLFNVVDEGIHYQLRIEALNLLRVFFFGKSNFPNNEIPQRYSKIVQIIDLLPFKSRDEIIKWVFVYQDIEKKYRKFPKSYYYSSPDEIMYSSTTRIAEDNIQFYFFKFLVDILKLTESSLKSISPVELRKYLIIFSKVQSSNNLDYLFDTIEQTENMNELNSMLLILGQAKYEEKLFEKTGSREFTEELQTHLQKDEGEISYYENDDVYLFAYKYLLYKMKRMSTNVKLVFKNFFKITKMTITESANQAKKTTKNQLYEDVQDLLEEIHEFDQKSQLEWILECVQDMSQSCSRKTTIANDFKQIDQIEEFRYIVLAQQNVSKFTPLNIQLIQPSFMQLIKFLIESSQTRAMRVLLYQSIEEYLLFFQSQQYNTYGNRAYSIPGFQQNEDRRISKNWAYALFNVFFFEFSQKNPYVLNANRVYQIIKIHHCWDIGLVYLEKVVEMMNENLLEADIQVYEKIQQIYQDLGETDYMYGTMNQLIRNDNLRKALCLVQQREFLQAQKALIENIDKLNENDQSRCDLYSSHTQDYETLYFISTYRQLFIETQKNLNEWDTLLNLSKVEQNDHLLSESSYFSLNKNIKELSRVLDKDLQILRETKERQCEYQNFYFQPSFMYHHVNILQQFSKGVQFLQIEQSLQKAGIQLAYEWSALPKTITKMHHNLITQFQIITELEEAHRVYGKFKSSEQKYFNSSIDTFHFMNQQWRERMPHKYESLLNWKMLVNQREYMQNTFFEIIKQIIDKNMQQQPNPNLLKQYKENILMQHMDLDYNNYQYFKILQNYGITNINLLPPRRNEIAPIEDNYLRLKCLMKNWLIDSSSTTEENIQEIKKIFNENIQKYLQSENQKQMNQKNTKQYFESMQEIKHYFEQMHEQINLKFSQTLFKKKNYFETIQNVKMLLNRPYNLQKICYTYLEICLRILKSVRSHTDYFNKMIITLIGEALKYKPYYSRMYFILFCQPEFIGQNLDSLAQTAYPRSFSNSLILWLPKILYMYQKFKDQGNNYSQVYLKLLEQLRQQYDQYLFLTLRSYLPQKQEKQERNSLQQIYMQMREILSSRKIESLFKTLQSPLIEDPQQIFLTLEMRYQELDQILELIQNYPSQQVYEEMLVQQLIPQLENSAQNLNKIIPEFVKIQSVNQFINPKSPPSIVMDFIRTKLYAGIIQYFNKYKHLFNLEYSIKNLLQFQLDAQDIEIPGQYVIKNPRIFREFTPKNHIFMSSLNKEVELYPSYRKFVKRIFINATNCKQYAYEFDYDYYNEYKNGNQYTRCSEEVNAHIQLQIGILQQCLNSQFFKSRETYTRNLKLSYPVKLPLNCSSKSQILSLKASSRTLYSMQTVHDWYLTQYCSKNGSQYIDNFNTHLDKFDFTNANIINQSMRDLIKGNALCQFILSKCNTYQEYIDFRQEFTYNYAAASFCNYILGQTVNLQDIYFDYNTGEVFINTNNLEIRNIKDQGNQVIYKNHNSIRISNSIAKFIGQIGISGIMCSSFIAMAKSITTKEYPFLDAMESIIQDLLALNDIKDVRLIFEKIIQKILWIYSQEYQTNNFSKNEICTRVYTIFDTIQENQLNVYNPVSHKYWF